MLINQVITLQYVVIYISPQMANAHNQIFA